MRFALAAAVSLLAVASAEARPVVFAREAPSTGALVLPLASEADLAVRGAGLDPEVRAAVARALASAKFKYEAKKTLSLRGIGPYDQIVVVGLGSAAPDAVGLQDAAGLGVRAAGASPTTLVATGLPQGAAQQAALGTRLGTYEFKGLKRVDPSAPTTQPGPITVVTPDAEAARAGFQRDGAALVDGVVLARDLISTPSNLKYPEQFVALARERFQGVSGVRIEVLDVAAMERLGMGSLLAVGRGSERPPRMMIVEYRGPGATGAPVALVGKGITFDTGGISIKPGENMWRMRYDMSGAAAVIGTTLSLAKAQAPVHVVAIAALAENMPDGRSYRPGDVVTAMNGKTIEVISTDAEGRMVLADGVAYAESRFKPAAIVDIATLTGAVRTALGDEYAGLFSRHDGLADQLQAAGRATGEHLWRLPLHPSYAEDVKSTVADMKNSGGALAGAGTGAHIIGEFVTEATPWAHLDIAGMAWADSAQPTTPQGAVGFGVRLLDSFVRNFDPSRAK
jgi:leucyl aminopeptidase